MRPASTDGGDRRPPGGAGAARDAVRAQGIEVKTGAVVAIHRLRRLNAVSVMRYDGRSVQGAAQKRSPATCSPYRAAFRRWFLHAQAGGRPRWDETAAASCPAAGAGRAFGRGCNGSLETGDALARMERRPRAASAAGLSAAASGAGSR